MRVRTNIKKIPAVIALMIALCTCGIVTAAASEAVGNAKDYPSYPFEFGGYDEKLIISGSSWGYDESSGLTDSDIIRLKAEEDYDLQRYIDTTEKRHDLSLIILRYAEWSHMEAFLAAYGHGEIESGLADKAKHHVREAVFDSSQSDLEESIFGTSDVPLRMEDNFTLLLDEGDAEVVFVINHPEGLFGIKDSRKAFKVARNFAEDNGYQMEETYTQTVWYQSNELGNMADITEIDEDYIALKEVHMKIYPY